VIVARRARVRVAAWVAVERRHCTSARCGHCSTCASDQMLRRIIPTAERTVTRGGNKTIDKGDAIRERPHGKRFLRVERFGRLRSYVRPFGAAHTSAGLDEVRRTGSLSLERALCSCSASGCSRHSVTTVSFITFRCACQTRSSGPLACSDGGLFLMPLRTSRRESIRQFSSSPRRSGPAYWPRPP